MRFSKVLSLTLFLPAAMWCADTHLGKGCTTAFVIDEDCDGYGVGDSIQPDADDTDAAVQTAAQGIAKWGSMALFLNHLGWSAIHIYYIDGAAGSDTTGAVNDPAHPYLTTRKVNTLVAAGDTILYRAGTYTSGITIKSGSSSGRITYMAYPGEKVIVDISGNNISALNNAYFNVVGFEVTNSAHPTLGYGLYIVQSQHWTLKYNLAHHNYDPIFPQWNITDGLVDHNVAHDGGEHAIYIGNLRQYGDSSLTVSNNIFYHGGGGVSQINGYFTAVQFFNNIIHSAEQGLLNLLSGVQSSNFHDNIFFSYNSRAVILNTYDNAALGTIGSRDMTGNHFYNNVFWEGDHTYQGTQTLSQNAPSVWLQDTTTCQCYSMGGNTFENNIFYTYSGPAFSFSGDSHGTTAFSTTVAKNNVAYVSYAPTNTRFVLRSGSSDFLTYAQAAVLAPSNLTGNVFGSDPLFTHALDSDYASPQLYDFTLQPPSPALRVANFPGAPARDLKGVTRTNPTDAGVYQQSASTGSHGSCDLNGDGLINLLDVQLAIADVLSSTTCGTSLCSLVDVQRIIYAALSGLCS